MVLIYLCICMRLSEPSTGFELLLLYITTLGPCLTIVMYALSAKAEWRSILMIIAKVFAYSSLIVVVGFLSGMKREQDKERLPTWQKIFMENVIIILAFYNLSEWARLNFVEDDDLNDNLHKYWGLSYTVMASIAMPLYKFFRFHVTAMLFQVAFLNHFKDRQSPPQAQILVEGMEEADEQSPLINRNCIT